MLAAANTPNLKSVFDGYQTIAKSLTRKEFEIKINSHFGEIMTPWFRDTFNGSYFEEDKYHHMVLEFPWDLSQQVDSGSQVIQLEVDTREEEGWKEKVSYLEGPWFVLVTERKSRKLAEAHSQSMEGHLASILSEEDLEEVAKLLTRRGCGDGQMDPHGTIQGGRKMPGIWVINLIVFG